MEELRLTKPFSIWYEKDYLNYIYLMNNYKFTLNPSLTGNLYKDLDNLFQDMFKGHVPLLPKLEGLYGYLKTPLKEAVILEVMRIERNHCYAVFQIAINKRNRVVLLNSDALKGNCEFEKLFLDLIYQMEDYYKKNNIKSRKIRGAK